MKYVTGKYKILLGRTGSDVLKDCLRSISPKMNAGALEERGQYREEKGELQALCGAGKILRYCLKSLYLNMATHRTINHQLTI